MGWLTYRKLLEVYEGSLSKATKKELAFARRDNPNNWPSALGLAQRDYAEARKCGCGRVVEADSYIESGDDTRHCRECRMGIEQIDEDNERKVKGMHA